MKSCSNGAKHWAQQLSTGYFAREATIGWAHCARLGELVAKAASKLLPAKTYSGDGSAVWAAFACAISNAVLYVIAVLSR